MGVFSSNGKQIQTIVRDSRETLWLRTVVLNRVDIDGNPNIRQNGGIRGLADVHCLGSMGNHGRRKTADYKIYEYTSCQALLDPDSTSDVSVGRCMVLLASRDIQKDEQIICNYEPNAAKDMDIPFDNVSMGQFAAYAARAWILASRERVLFFSEKSAFKLAACFGYENAGGQ